MPNHLQLVSEAKVAIDKVFGDSSVDQQTTHDSLEEIREHIDDTLATLRECAE